MRKIDKLIIHCSATPEGRAVSVKDIDKWHREKGYNGIGYHYVIGLNGEVWKGRDINLIGDLEKAEIVKQKITTVVENIRLQYPYLNEI